MTGTQDWKAVVAEWRASGLSAEKFSEGREFSRARLWSWSSRLHKAERKTAGEDGVRLVRVARQRAPGEGGASVTVEIEGARILVRAGVERGTLSTVLEVLRGLRVSP